MDLDRHGRIDPDFLCYRLTMDNRIRPVVQRRRKFNEERCLVIKTETQKLLNADHIMEIQYRVAVKRSVGSKDQRQVENVH